MKRSTKPGDGRRRKQQQKKQKERAERLRRARAAERTGLRAVGGFEDVEAAAELVEPPPPDSPYLTERSLRRLERSPESGVPLTVGDEHEELEIHLAPDDAELLESSDDRELAQELAFRAYEALSDHRLEAVDWLTRKALSLDPHCSDAILARAQIEAGSRGDWLRACETALRAARRSLGDDFIASHRGDFSGIVITRPFMRALQALESALWIVGRQDEAIATGEEMLELCPEDDLLHRYVLLGRYLGLDRHADAVALLDRHPDDAFAAMSWARALLAFLRGDMRAAGMSLARAREANDHVERYLIGESELPKHLPTSYTHGSPEEAVFAAYALRTAWQRAPGAVAWLRVVPKRRASRPARVHATDVDLAQLGAGWRYLSAAGWYRDAAQRFYMRVVLRAGALAPGEERESDLRCRRKPAGRACKTLLDVSRSADGAQVGWHCSSCHDSGTIVGHEKSFVGLAVARRAAWEAAEPGVLRVELTTNGHAELLSSPLLYEQSWALLEAASEAGTRFAVHGRAEELEPLLACAIAGVMGEPTSFLAPAERDLRGALARSHALTESERTDELLLHRAVEERSPLPAPEAGMWRVRFELEDSTPPAWRELRLPGGMNLAQLHVCLQLALGLGEVRTYAFHSADDGAPAARSETLASLGLAVGRTGRYRYGPELDRSLRWTLLGHDAEYSLAISLMGGEGSAASSDEELDLDRRGRLLSALAVRLWGQAARARH